ncbi:hypothetical protein ACFWC5_42145 [Streptomyces sp. NPDC060085]|uniref:hypothetical protein n=1 Tax=Streptomyces sp. NPDC060085 TaxID=3347054 RepID=UPI00365DFED4
MAISVTVYPADEDGYRCVRVGEEVIGRVLAPKDIFVLFEEAGLVHDTDVNVVWLDAFE